MGGAWGVQLKTPGSHHHIGGMCGRYASFLPAEALARVFGTMGPLPNLEPTWNMAPTKFLWLKSETDGRGRATDPRVKLWPDGRSRYVGNPVSGRGTRTDVCVHYLSSDRSCRWNLLVPLG